jgi:hypothetical protein
LHNFYRWIAVLRGHKALILAKNVLYKANHEGYRRQSAPLSGALFFAAASKGFG